MAVDRVRTEYGEVQGVSKDAYSVFRGIPYAKAPVGELRWQPPQPLGAWDGVYSAEKFPCKSMQEIREMPFYDKEFYSEKSYDVPCSEDSLYLNIWTPAKSGEEKLPVAVWIHGGAFMGGYGSEMEFDGERFCENGIILVTINYRLNLFGFLAHPWLSAESEKGVSGNYGIMDQITALQWVSRNIRAFGGDPEVITVMGQSAGAMSVQTLVSSPLTENMMSKAVMQSGGGYNNGMNDDLSLEEAMTYGEAFVKQTGAKNLHELREMSAEELYVAFVRFMGEMMQQGAGLVMRPNVDGYVLPEGYDRQIEQGKIKKIPYLIGSNQNDIFVEKKDADAGVKSRLYQGCVDWSRFLEQAGADPAYVYYFKRQLPGDDAGAFHSAELWYMFGTLSRCWRPMTEADFALSERMIAYWSNFIKTGKPNSDEADLAEWKPCKGEDEFVLELDV